MQKISLYFFEEDCNGCHACEVACKQEHRLHDGPRLVKVIEKSPRFIPVYCRHCDDPPPCGEACPVEAITKDDCGIVLIDDELCTGCGECVEACPYGAMQYDEDQNIAVKCDLCSDRIEKGEAPACSLVCPSHCILWGDPDGFPEAAKTNA